VAVVVAAILAHEAGLLEDRQPGVEDADADRPERDLGSAP
jgi:hypothetical protein